MDTRKIILILVLIFFIRTVPRNIRNGKEEGKRVVVHTIHNKSKYGPVNMKERREKGERKTKKERGEI